MDGNNLHRDWSAYGRNVEPEKHEIRKKLNERILILERGLNVYLTEYLFSKFNI
jgi:hypothetical protein